MLEIELAVLASLSDTRKRRFTWLSQARLSLSQNLAEAICFGVVEIPQLDRQMAATELALLNLVPDLDQAVELAAEYAVRDAALIHGRGEPPAGFDCAVCSGRYSIDEILKRAPAPIE